MDDFCKQQHIFTNPEAKRNHEIETSRKMHKIYEQSLERATKTFPVKPDVYGMDVFLLPIKKDDDDKKGSQTIKKNA